MKDRKLIGVLAIIVAFLCFFQAFSLSGIIALVDIAMGLLAFIVAFVLMELKPNP